MKTKTEIVQVADLQVIVSATPDITAHPHVIRYRAKCGDGKEVTGSMPLPARHDRIIDHLDKDHRDFVRRISAEAAGHERSRLHIKEFFSEGSAEKS